MVKYNKGDDFVSNIIDYIKWRGDISFDVDPFNEIDALIFSELTYIPFELILNDSEKGESLSNLATKFFSKSDKDIKMGAIIPEDKIKETFNLVSTSKRFKDVTLKQYLNIFSKEEEKQFCGMCFVINKDYACISYRGTDDTLVGWKEDFNMSFNTPIPAQLEAVKHLNTIGAKSRKKLYVCGHSKGGNLASYAALFADARVKKKIVNVFSFDGPGFRAEFLESINDEETKAKTIKFLPQSSIIGMIYDPVGACVYLKSLGKGMYQHDAFNWQVLSNKFELVEGPDKTSLDVHNLLNKWTASMSKEERVEFVEALYKLVTVNDTATLSDIASDKFKFILGIIKSDGSTKKVFLSAINRLIKEKYFKKEEKKSKASKKDTSTVKNETSHD